MLEVALVNIRSCANVGNILRTAKSFNFTHVHVVGTTPDIRRKEVMKASLGGENNLATRYTSWNNFLQKNGSATIIALETGGEDIQNFKPKNERTILVLGNERVGLAEGERKNCHHVLSITHNQKIIQSLNVSSAFAIAANFFYSQLTD